MTSRFVTVTENVRLWTESVGDEKNPPLLLIAGGNLSGYSWPDPFVDILVAGGIRVIRYDHRDTGKSTNTTDFEKHPYGFDTLVADAVSVLDAWEIDRGHVLGMSLGNTITQLLAIRHPDRIASWSVLLGGALDIDFDANIERALAGAPSIDGLPLPTPRFLEVLNLMSEQPDGTEELLEQRVEKWRLLNGADAPFDAEAFRSYEQRAIDHAGSAVESFVHHLIPQPPVEVASQLGAVDAPLLAIQAQLDPAAPPPHAQHLADLVPNSRHVTIHDMGHAIAPHVHERLAAAVADHIRTHT